MMGNKLLFYGFILVALIMVANVSVTETFAKTINGSIFNPGGNRRVFHKF